MKIFGKEFILPKIGLERVITYGIITALVIALTWVSKCKKSNVSFKDCEEIAINYADTAYLHQIEDLATEYSKMLDKQPKGETVTIIDTQYINHTTFVKNWFDLQAANDQIDRLQDKLEEAEKHNSLITKDQFDKDGGAMVQTVPIEKELPTVRTIERDSGKNFSFMAEILSTGPLVSYTHDIEVNPEKIYINVVGPTEYITKKNSLGITAGIIYFDPRTYYYPATLRYGHKWWSLELGPVFNKDFKFEGAEAKVGAEIKF